MCCKQCIEHLMVCVSTELLTGLLVEGGAYHKILCSEEKSFLAE